MSARRKTNQNKSARKTERRYTVRGIRRQPPDLTKLSKALLGFAAAEAERDAQASHAEQTKAPGRRGSTSMTTTEPVDRADA